MENHPDIHLHNGREWHTIHFDPEESYYKRIGVIFSNQNYPCPETTQEWYALVAEVLDDFRRMAAVDFRDYG